jgi:AcrR family transcriptional regulator
MGVEMPAEEKTSRPVGRPRDETVGPLIRQTARDLVVERGYDAVTTEMIARAAGVSKQTIYRRWRTKADLVLDAFLEYAKTNVDQGVAAAPMSIEQELAGFVHRTFVALEDTGPAIRSLMAWAQQDPEFRVSFRERFIAPRRAMLRSIIARAIPGDRRSKERALNAAVIALYGAVWYRLLLDEPFDAGFGKDLADLMLNGLASDGRERPRRRPRPQVRT